jgi:hypothetical protein
MSGTWTDSPVAEAIAHIARAIAHANGKGHVICRAQAGNQGSSYRVLSYREDFSYLWDFGSTPAHENLVPWILSRPRVKLKDAEDSPERTLVVVWDGIPASRETAINIASYVTPYDWAVACSRTVFQQCRGTRKLTEQREKQLPTLRILIIDLQSQLYDHSFGAKAFSAVASVLPWVQVYRPAGCVPLVFSAASGAADIAMFRPAVASGSLDPECLIDDLSEVGRIFSLRDVQKDKGMARSRHDDDESRRDYEAILNTLCSLWASNLTSPGDRHHVGNLLAPYILAGGLSRNLAALARDAIEKGEDRAGSEVKGSSLRTALVTLAKSVGLKMSSDDKSSGKGSLLSDAFYAEDIHGRRRSVSVLLVDDQYSLGYNHLLGYLFFGFDYDPTKAVKDDSGWEYTHARGGYPNRLRCEGTAESLLRVLGGCDPVSDWNSPRYIDLPCDVLLLDLRVWTNAEERRSLLERLVQLCNRLQAHGINAIDAHFQDAFAAAKGIVDGKDADEIKAIALLPLLLSHYDPSLPIVIFSSTHQRAVTEMLAHRPNILLDFTKPIFTGYGDIPEPADILGQLRRALENAIRLHECRPIWGRLCELQDVDPQCYWITDPTDQAKRKCFNSCGPVPAGWTRIVAGGSKRFPLDAAATQRTLSKLFLGYILEQRFRDFGSVPWEFLEGILKPSNSRNFDFPRPCARLTCVPERNHIAAALKLCRHRKVHGRFEHIDANEKGSRAIAVVMFRFLLDLLSPTAGRDAPPRSLAASVRSGLQSRYKHLMGISASAESLVGDQEVSWADFATLALAEAASRAGGSISSVGATEIVRLVYRCGLGSTLSPILTVRTSPQLNESQLETLVKAETLGKVISVVPKSYKTKLGQKGKCFHVTMASCQDAWLVKAELDGRVLNGVRLHVR